MADSKSIDTPMPTNGKFDRDEHGNDIEVKMYRINFCVKCILHLILWGDIVLYLSLFP